jgi:hypothetical protein
MLCLLDAGEDAVYGLIAPWPFGSDDPLWVTPDMTRYGCLPAWFPAEDQQGNAAPPQAQVDRFLSILSRLIPLPEDHTQTDLKALVWGLCEMARHWADVREAFED